MEKQAEVGVAGAEALGKMGANGAGDVNLGVGESGEGFNMAAMVASMAVGGAVGQNIAGVMNNMMGSMGQTVQSGIMPPPIPATVYYVVIDGKAAGPFEVSVLAQMISTSQFNEDSLVWRKDMEQWVKAGSVDELKGLFVNMPSVPPIPQA